MASTYSDLGLELMATGENAGTWGDKTNANLNLINQVAAGYESIALSDGGNVPLALTDGALSNARNMILKFTGTLTTASTVTIPDSLEKFYIIDLSAVVGVTNLTIKTVSGTGFTAGEAAIIAAYSDGTNLIEIALNTLGGTIGTAQIADAAVTTAKILDANVTTAKILDANVTTAKIADDAVTTAKILDANVTTAKIADDAVTADKLADTAVTPGAYTAAEITVDAQGRITAAASGSGGGGGFTPVKVQAGPASGTLALPTQSQVLVYGVSGGGGGSGSRGQGWGPSGAQGGKDGRYAVIVDDVTAPFSAAYAVGAGGAGGSPGQSGFPSGGTGGVTSLTGIFSLPGGGGGSGPGGSGPSGTAAAVTLNSPTAVSPYTTTSHGEYLLVPSPFGTYGSGGGAGGVDNGSGGGAGTAGFIVVYGG